VVNTEHVTVGVAARTSISQSEKRGAPRIKCNVFLELMGPSDHVTAIGRLHNMSMTGACISSTQEFRTGDSVHARMPTLRSGANRLVGHIVWSRTTGGTTLYGVSLASTVPL